MQNVASRRNASVAAPTAGELTSACASQGAARPNATASNADTISTSSRPWRNTAPTAHGRPRPTCRAVRIWIPSTRPSGTTRNSCQIESATAIAASSVTPTRARKIVFVTCNTISLTPANMIGSDRRHKARDSPCSLNAACSPASIPRPPAPAAAAEARHGPGLRRQRDRIRLPVQVHGHAGQQRAALHELAQVEIAHLEGQVRGDVLEAAVLGQLERVILGAGLELVDVRGVEDAVAQADRVADAVVGHVDRDIDDVRDRPDLGDLASLEQRRADERVLAGDREDRAVEVVEVRVADPDLDDPGAERLLHPLVRGRLRAHAGAADVDVVVEVLEIRLALELVWRHERVVTERLEERAAHPCLAAARRRRVVG